MLVSRDLPTVDQTSRDDPVHTRTSTRLCVTETEAPTLSSGRSGAATTVRPATISEVMSTREWRAAMRVERGVHGNVYLPGDPIRGRPPSVISAY